jgi:hypothetical protein
MRHGKKEVPMGTLQYDEVSLETLQYDGMNMHIRTITTNKDWKGIERINR